MGVPMSPSTFIPRVFNSASQEHAEWWDKDLARVRHGFREGIIHTHPTRIYMPKAHNNAIRNLLLALAFATAAFGGGVHVS